MDRILGETFEVALGGEKYTLSPVKLKTLSRAMSFFKRRKVSDFISIAKEAELPEAIFSKQLATLYEERDTIGLEDFLDKHDGDPEFTWRCLYFGFREFKPDLTWDDFELFPDADLEAVLPDFLGEAATKAAEAKIEQVKKKAEKRKGTA